MHVINLKALRIVSFLCVGTLPVAGLDRDWSAVLVLAIAAALAWFPGYWGSAAPAEVSDRVKMAEVAASWVQVAMAGAGVTMALALLSSDEITLVDPLSALFEATSGVSTTGLTMVDDPSQLSSTMQWWRSVLQWGGAIGVITFGLNVAERSGDRDAGVSSEWSDQPDDDHRRSTWIILGLLSAITVVGFVGLWALGDRPWVAANHAVTAAATGGFSVRSTSVEASPAPARAFLALLCLVSAVSFATLWGTVSGKGPPIWKRTQVRTALFLLVTLGAMSTVAASGRAPIGNTVFNAVSASATAGFSAGDGYATIPGVAMVTLISMFIGGAAGSTAGGVKAARVAWIAKATRRWLPQEGDVYRKPFIWDGEEVGTDEAADRITGAGSLIAVFATSAIVAAYALTVTADVGALDGAFESVSALSGVGLSRGVTAPDLAAAPKLVLIATMLAGRVEVTAFLALAAVAAGRTSRASES